MADQKNPRQRARESRLRWIRIGDLRVHPDAQREFRRGHGDKIAAELRLEDIGYLIVNVADGRHWVLDGQHRLYALKANGFEDDDLIQCECYEGMSVNEMAERFLVRNDQKTIGTFDKFRIGVLAGRPEEADIQRVVQAQGYRIGRDDKPGTVRATGSLRFVYRLDPNALGRSLRILGGAWDGDSDGFSSALIKGMGLVCARFNGELDDDRLVQRLSGLAGGPMAIKRKAASLQLKTGHTSQNCTAAAIVDTYNAGRGGQKLPSWWS